MKALLAFLGAALFLFCATVLWTRAGRLHSAPPSSGPFLGALVLAGLLFGLVAGAWLLARWFLE